MQSLQRDPLYLELVHFYMIIYVHLYLSIYNGIGIPELAERCGLKRQRAKKLMNGEVKMSIAEAVSIVNEFQVSLEYLLGRYPYPLPAPQTEEEWMVYEKLGQMDENEAQKYLEMMMPMKKGLS